MATEKRLIDANKLVEDLEAAKDHGGMGACVAGTLIRYVKRCATVDAVEVVRCKDCKHWHHSGYCRKIGTEHDRLGSDFCSYGGRKDNEGKAN